MLKERHGYLHSREHLIVKQSIFEVFAEDVSMESTLSRIPVTPFITTLGSSLMTGRTYVVSTERQKAKFTSKFVQR
ncbi:unnamed protein product [Clavelina lepadiformis]|uniref:Uncharacterized protein n=1 Tax=Clavelina lepadiformis TaxID=159417 RepID=A0ABP0FM42_CLALP